MYIFKDKKYYLPFWVVPLLVFQITGTESSSDRAQEEGERIVLWFGRVLFSELYHFSYERFPL